MSLKHKKRRGFFLAFRFLLEILLELNLRKLSSRAFVELHHFRPGENAQSRKGGGKSYHRKGNQPWVFNRGEQIFVGVE